MGTSLASPGERSAGRSAPGAGPPERVHTLRFGHSQWRKGANRTPHRVLRAPSKSRPATLHNVDYGTVHRRAIAWERGLRRVSPRSLDRLCLRPTRADDASGPALPARRQSLCLCPTRLASWSNRFERRCRHSAPDFDTQRPGRLTGDSSSPEDRRIGTRPPRSPPGFITSL